MITGINFESKPFLEMFSAKRGLSIVRIADINVSRYLNKRLVLQ